MITHIILILLHVINVICMITNLTSPGPNIIINPGHRQDMAWISAHALFFIVILCHSINTQSFSINKTDITEIDKSQAKLLNSAIGWHIYYRNTALLNAMNVNNIPKLRDIYTLQILRNAMFSQSQATTFYNFIINSGLYNNPCNLVLE